MAQRHRTTPLLRLLGRLGWQRDPDLWTVHCRDGHGRRARILVHLSAAGVYLTVPDHGPLQLSALQAGSCARPCGMRSSVSSGWRASTGSHAPSPQIPDRPSIAEWRLRHSRSTG